MANTIDNIKNKTYYNDFSVSEVYKNFLIKYPIFGIIRFFFLGFFGFIFKMMIRISRTVRDPETKKIKIKYLFGLLISIAFISLLFYSGFYLVYLNGVI